MTNPLVAAPVSSTTAFTGIQLLEDAQSVKTGIESGDWASAVLGAAGTAMDALAVVADPFGAILSSGVSWLMEHVGPLKDALDKLAGDPDQITAKAQTWQNISQELAAIGEDLTSLVQTDLQGWSGSAADAYRQRASDLAAVLGAASEAGAGAGTGVQTAGEVVAAVRSLVRDTIAKVVSHMISWALQVVFTLGVGLTWVVPQVVNLVARTATQIAGLVKRLVSALKTLSGLLGRASKVFDGVSDALKKVKTGKVSPPTAPGKLPPGVNSFIKLGGGAPGASRAGGPAGHAGGGTTASHAGGGGGSRSLDDDLPIAPDPPPQSAYGNHPAIPQSAHDHVIFGNLKPPRKPNKPWGFTGGHVLHDDLPAGTTAHNSAAAGANPSWHGAGVTGVKPPPPGLASVPGPGPFGSVPAPNGVYHLSNPTMTPPPGHIGDAGKPGSTMFPQGMNPGLVQNVGNQAWNGGATHGPMIPVTGPNGVKLDPHGNPQSYTWQGHGQIPYTPIWDERPDGTFGPTHGSGAGNHPNAGSTIHVSGYANPDYSAPAPPGIAAPPGGTAPAVIKPATYYPDGRN
ncbi:WXG100 family type VII secretion target [Amycolatopsis carbonis]|uniref:WXG100 family type VII secretion target n=1 Tax=Amycolatopsis carbonis TaxID=715471 RepID=A0A9Y2IPP2_9PSEU|nr:WXG100 family type VII secretion target [Amycolatopsis sp. 2-15]WIX83010.1 WXG100 family type VII secretion target [Amycolatopsis sp. 2-15]